MTRMRSPSGAVSADTGSTAPERSSTETPAACALAADADAPVRGARIDASSRMRPNGVFIGCAVATRAAQRHCGDRDGDEAQAREQRPAGVRRQHRPPRLEARVRADARAANGQGAGNEASRSSAENEHSKWLCVSQCRRAAQRERTHEVRVAHSAQEACPPDERSNASGKLLIRRFARNACDLRSTCVFVTFLILRNALRHKLRTLLTVVGIVVAIVAFGLLRTVVDAWYAGANASSIGATRHAQRGVARLLDAAQLCAEDPAGRRRRVGVVGELVRRRLHQRAQLLSAVRDRAGELSRHVSRVRAVGRRAQGVRHRPRRRDRRTQARRRSTAGRSATRSRCAARSSPALDVHAARHLRRRRQVDRPVDDVLPLGVPERVDQAALRAPRRPDRRVHRAARAIPDARPRSRQPSTRCSRTRSPKRSPKPRRPSSSASSR